MSEPTLDFEAATHSYPRGYIDHFEKMYPTLAANLNAQLAAAVAQAREEERATTQQLREALAELIQRVDAVGNWQRGTNPVTDQHRLLASPERAT